MGRTNLEIFGSTPFFSSRQFMVTGSVAELEAVPQAVVMAPNMFFMNLKGSFRVKMVKMRDRSMKVSTNTKSSTSSLSAWRQEQFCGRMTCWDVALRV